MRARVFGAALLLMTAVCGGAAAQEPVWQRFEVERNSFSKKVTFQPVDGSRKMVMKYKGIPVAWGSAIQLLVDPDVYEKQSHRVRYRFRHPLSERRMVLLARAKSHRVGPVPIRSEDTLPVVELFADDEESPRGTLRYDDHARVLFAGQIEERRIEIERVSEDTPPDAGVLKYLLFPYPVSGTFVIRVDGREAARFNQWPQHGVTSPYDLELDAGADPVTREDAMLAFVVFDLMKDFVNSAG
ncbi:MAG TPA: hypothetical protein DD490_16325 [Acidobacteria bacterium]|nr:hypothetical protein [Acidobacteriota bacterium]